MRERLIPHAIEGALGGAVGTMFMSGAPHLLRVLPMAFRPPELRREPGALVVSRIEELRGRPFPIQTHARCAAAVHWIYGIGLGALFGAATAHRTLRAPGDALVAGAAFGGAVWAVEYGALLPSLKLTPPLQRQGLRHAASALATLVAYGLIAAAPIFVIDRFARKQSWYSRLVGAFPR